MMRLKIFLSFILMLTVTSIAAEETDGDLWNWAWHDETGALLAYSDSGKTETLLSEGVAWAYDVWRLGRDDAIGLLEVSDQAVFYRLSSHAAQPLTPTFDLETLRVPFHSRYGYRLEAYHFPYLLFTPAALQSSPPIASGVLINLETNQIELVSHDIGWRAYGACCRFTEDGTRLRYLAAREADDLWALDIRERTMTTAEDRLLTSVNGSIRPDRYGRRWFLQEWDDFTEQTTFQILDLDEAAQSQVLKTPAETYPLYSYEFVGDDLMSYQPNCATHCVMEILTQEGETYVYSLPPAPNGSSIYYGWRFGQDTVFIGRLEDYWFLSSEGGPRFIGYNYAAGSHLPPTISPDHRWVLVADTPQYPYLTRSVWDLTTQRKLLTLDQSFKDSLSMIWEIDGFIANALDQGDGLMYRYADQSAVRLPEAASRTYFDILPDGSVLYEAWGSKTIRAGIYRYQPGAETFTLLIADVHRIPLLDIEYDYQS